MGCATSAMPASTSSLTVTRRPGFAAPPCRRRSCGLVCWSDPASAGSRGRGTELLGLALVLKGESAISAGPALVDIGTGVALDGAAKGLDGLGVIALAEVQFADQATHVGG